MSGVGEQATSEGFRSRFGGFWVDRHDADEVLEERARTGEIGPELADRIRRFMTDGYVIIPGAVTRETTAQVRAEIDEIWATAPEGSLIETAGQRFVPPDPRLRSKPSKLLDVHAFSGAARRAIAAPSVMELLTTIFEARPKAFQTLGFSRGSGQAIHKDTAYVEIADEPMHFAATWLALEDVQPRTGGLEYYVGSHRDPDFLFGGKHKWMTAAPRDHLRFLASLHLDAKRYGHRKETFLAREGDVLVWHADLAHGGSRVRRRRSSRHSLVTHLTPEHDDPPYARQVERTPVEQDGCLFVSHHHQI